MIDTTISTDQEVGMSKLVPKLESELSLHHYLHSGEKIEIPAGMETAVSESESLENWRFEPHSMVYFVGAE
jgi:hypothetical protein